MLDRTNGASNVIVTLSWEATSCAVTNPRELSVTCWNGAEWVDRGNGGTTGTNANGTILTALSVTIFSLFTLASMASSNPLPIELINFGAIANDNSVDAKWQTVVEINNAYFTVQRSKNGYD